MSRRTLVFVGFVSALSFGGTESAITLSISTVCVLILSVLCQKIPFLCNNTVNKLFLVCVFCAAVQIVLNKIDTSDSLMILCLIANISVVSVIETDIKEALRATPLIIAISLLIGAISPVSSVAFGLLIAGVAVAFLSRRKCV